MVPSRVRLRSSSSRIEVGAQAFVDLLFGGPKRNALLVGVEMELAFLAVPNQAALRGQHDLFAAAADGPADNLLRPAIAVDRSGVQQVNAMIERGMDGSMACFSSAPPHIQPPMAQAPKPTAETSIPDDPVFDRACFPPPPVGIVAAAGSATNVRIIADIVQRAAKVHRRRSYPDEGALHPAPHLR